jgi:2-keto-4-pentenoate hydratase
MATLDVREKARRTVELFRSRQPIEILPADLYPANLDEAYAIRRAFQEIEETEGRGAVAGYKIGLTTPVMQRLCGVGEPCYGAIFTTRGPSPPGRIGSRRLLPPRGRNRDCLSAGRGPAARRRSGEIGAAVESCMAAIELIEDLHYDYKRLDAAAMVAGNVWNAGVVLGTPVTDWRTRDLARATARLSINGQEIGSGNGGDVMGHPLNALAWLADKLAAAGTPLRRGMIVMTGSMVPIQYPMAGDRVLVEVSGLGSAELVLS